MKVRKLTGISLATAAAGLFALGATLPAKAASHAGAVAAKVKCEGVNACKGKGDCKSASNACKGQAACKGKGFSEMSQADCDKAKAAMKK